MLLMPLSAICSWLRPSLALRTTLRENGLVGTESVGDR